MNENQTESSCPSCSQNTLIQQIFVGWRLPVVFPSSEWYRLTSGLKDGIYRWSRICYCSYSTLMCRDGWNRWFNSVHKPNFLSAQQVDSMLSSVCSVIYHRWLQNMVRKKSGTWDENVNDVLTTFCLLWCLTVQTRGNIEFLLLITKQNCVNNDVICVSVPL